MKAILFAGIAALGFGLGFTAPAMAQPQRPACLQINQIQGYKPVAGNRALAVTDRANRRYRIAFTATCHDMQFNMNLGFHSNRNTKLACLTRGDYVVSRSTGTNADRCRIESVSYYTPQMERADADAARGDR